jgi:fluoroacetyl-CoA thioesterase
MGAHPWIGASATVQAVVHQHDTAVSLRSGDVNVLGTPRLVAWLEEATFGVLHELVSAEHTTVGTRIDVRHRRPTPLGAEVVCLATIVSVEGTQVVCEVVAHHVTEDGDRVEDIARGTITRAIVDRHNFGS